MPEPTPTALVTGASRGLGRGVALQLAPMARARVTVEHENATSMNASIAACHSAQNKICYAYMLMQVRQRDYGDVSQALKDSFQTAMTYYTAENHALAAATAQSIIDALQP